ncbi:MAG: DUF1343 domain-containing protein [Prolixibacteraceae bacterium]|nr:DUF1343 domain-containing protein [Prolixibacteraceae bacterium]MBN2775232.1 DUF1343 domain-containing protein [Prolixibacteraceae bacterium]
MKKKGIFFILLFISFTVIAQSSGIIAGAEQPEKYLNRLENRKIGLVANHTSMVKNMHLLDFLVSEKINVVTVFAPEHGFRGEASAGETVENGKDFKTGIKIVSIYGNNNKPTAQQLEDVDMMIFDIQDVGCRFYTYISTLHYIVEACAENGIPLIILDRPNPNGDYVAGPVLKPEFQSFVGMDQIPVVHGCTVGELALMINGESWIDSDKKCDIKVIPVANYTHKSAYSLPIAPSPNLPNDLAVRLYPSLCFFESTSVSIGRGTEFPFQVIGYPDESFGSFSFTPVEIPGVALNPKQEGKICYGEDLRRLSVIPKFTLNYFLEYYKKFKSEADFLTRERWLNLLSGDDDFIKLVRAGKSEGEIIEFFNSALDEYKKMRRKYLLYPDFE